MNTTQWIEGERKALAKQQIMLDFIEQHTEFFDSFKEGSLQNLTHLLDINNPTREQALHAIKYFHGKWEKEYMSSGINYSIQINEDIRIRLYCAPPPPSCKIISERRLVPAHVTPERWETVSRVVCNDDANQQSTELTDEDIQDANINSAST